MNKKTELAELIINDGQALRAIHNYLSETFDGLKHIDLFDCKFIDRIEFIKFIKDAVCPLMIDSLTEWKIDDPEGYNESNKENTNSF